MTQTLKLLWQTGILAGFAWAADWLARTLALPIPGNVLGIVALFALLCTGLVKESWISGAASFLLGHLVFFFVPIAVGLMNWGGVFYDYGWVLLAAIVLSTALPLFIVGYLAGALRRRAAKEAKPCGQ